MVHYLHSGAARGVHYGLFRVEPFALRRPERTTAAPPTDGRCCVRRRNALTRKAPTEKGSPCPDVLRCCAPALGLPVLAGLARAGAKHAAVKASRAVEPHGCKSTCNADDSNQAALGEPIERELNDGRLPEGSTDCIPRSLHNPRAKMATPQNPLELIWVLSVSCWK